MGKINNKKYYTLMVIILLVLSVVCLIAFGKVDKYKGVIKINNLNSKVLSSIANTSLTSSKGTEEVSYHINYTLDEVEGLDKRDVIIKGTLTSEYATFKEINKNNISSTLSNEGKEIEIKIDDVPLGVEQNLDIKIQIRNAPNNEEINPKIEIKEASGDFTRINTQNIKVETNSVEGIVLDENNLPVSNIELSINQNDTEIKRTYTKEDGTFVFSDLEEGLYQVKVEEDMYELDGSGETSESNPKLELKVKEVDKFNIETHKYIENLNLVVNGKEEKYSYVDSKKIVQNIKNAKTISGKIEYKIVVKNKGIRDTIVERVIDIPGDGLEFKPSDNTGWEKEDDILKYKPIEGSSLEPNETREIKLVLSITDTKEIKTYINKLTTKGEINEKVAYVIDGKVVREESIIEGDILTRPDFHIDDLDGWYTDINYTNKYKFNNPVNKNLILYARTKEAEKEYTVKFIDNGNIIKTETVKEGEKVSKPENPSKTGYTFECWKYDDSCYDFNNGVYEDINLVSNYDIVSYNLTYNLDGGEANNPSNYTVETDTFTLNNPSKTGYTFTGWTGNGLDTKTMNVTIEKGTTGNKTYTAHYSINNYTIEFYNRNSDGSYSVTKTIDKEYNTSLTNEDLPSVSLNGYRFKFFSLDKNTEYDLNSKITNNIKLYAVYEIENYTINYNLDGGSLEEGKSNPENYTVETDTFTLYNPIKTGFTFTGWTGNGLDTKTMNVTIEKGTTGNKSYQANYEINKYSVEFYNRNADGTYSVSKTIEKEYNTSITNEDLPEISLKGYTFKYYSLDKNAEYDLDSKITNNIKLYAVYEINNYTINYNLDYGSLDEGKTNPESYTVETDTFTLNNPKKTGYTFIGWMGTDIYETTENVTIEKGSTGNRTYSARYNINKYQLEIDPKGGEYTGDLLIEEDYGTVVSINEPTKTGYTFTGWTLTGKGIYNNGIYTFGEGNGKLEANYTLNTYNINYDYTDCALSEEEISELNNKTNYTVENNNFTLNNPNKYGYDFNGWSGTDIEDKIINLEINTNKAKNLSYKANCSLHKFRVTFKNEGSVVEEKEVEYNKKVTPISEPSKNGYTFKSWTLNGVDFNFDNKITNDIELVSSYTLNTYNITYKGLTDEEIISLNNPVNYTIETETFTLNNPNDRLDIDGGGEVFVGWKEKKEENPSMNITLPIVDKLGNKEYTAVFNEREPNVYNISYNLNGGSLEEENPSTYKKSELPITLNKPSKTGYTFIGWTGSNGDSPVKDLTIPTNTTGDLNYTANYTINSYKVEFYNLKLDGTYEKISELDKNYNTSLTNEELPNVDLLGHTFKYFSLDKETGYVISTPIIENIKLYAVYDKDVYSISYNLNGGSLDDGKTNPETYSVDTNTFTLHNPSKLGYTFIGWTGTGIETPTTTITITKGSIGNRTYTANYTPVEYNITYNLDGGSVEENPTKYTIERDSFTLHNPSKVGYTFIGWTGTDIISPSTSVTVSKGSIGDRTYTANYEPIEYSINYDLDGGSLDEGESNKDKYTIETNTFTLKNPKKTGYTFIGWTGTGIETPTINVTIEKGSIGARTYTANYSSVGYTITYNLDGGSVEVDNPTGYSIETNTFTLNNPSKEGYTFDGWTGTDLDNPTKTVTITKGSIGNRAYTANYTPIEYTISYDLNGGSLDEGESNKEQYTIETNTFTLKNPKKTGYTFIGWTGTDLDSPTTTVTITKGSIGSRSYTANYTPIEYTISYDLNGGSLDDEVSNRTKYTIETDSFILNNPSKTGYTFIGWTGTGIEEATLNVEITKGSTGNKSYQANYEINKYSVEFYNKNSNGTYDLEKTIENINYNTLIPSNKIPTVSLDGYTFNYWSLDKTNQFNLETPITDDIKLYAVYDKDVYTISYNLDGGSLDDGVSNPETYSVDTETFTLNNPSKTGYTFIGWTGSNGTNPLKNITLPDGELGNKNYRANYQINKYTVTYMNGDNKFYEEEVNYNEKAQGTSSIPEKAHNVFLNWRLNNQVYDFNTPVTNDITLHASFEEVAAPTISYTPLTWVKDSVTVTVSSNHNDYTYMYKIGDGNYQNYTGPFVVSQNTMVYAYSVKSDIPSVEITQEIDNIDKINPNIISLENTDTTPTTATIKVNGKDNESGIDVIKIYVDNELMFTSTPYTSDITEEKELTYTVTNLEQITTYTIKAEILDKVGNSSYEEIDVTTPPKHYVAAIIGSNGLIYNDEDLYIKFETLKEAIEYVSTTGDVNCITKQCTIKMLDNIEETNTILDGQDITIDLNGLTITGKTTNAFTNNGNLQIVDHNDEEIGSVISNGTGIINSGTLTIGENEDILSVSSTEPIIEGSNYGVENTGTLRFFDGKIIGSATTGSIRGSIDLTPYSYNASIKPSGGKEVASLEIIADAEARINSKYYTRVQSAVDDSKNGTYDDVEFDDYLIKQVRSSDDYRFIYSEYSNSIMSNNQGIDSSLAHSYLKLDLTNYEEDQVLQVSASISSQSGADFGYATITDSVDTPLYTDTEGRFIYISGTVESKDYTTILKKGNIYYLHIGYYKNGNTSSGEDTFTISNINLGKEVTSSLSDLSNIVLHGTSEYSFEKQQDGTYINNNQGVSNSSANSYFLVDLTNISDEKYLIIDASISSEYNRDYGYITVTNSNDIPSYSQTSGRQVCISGEVGRDSYIISLEPNKLNYIHLGYYKNNNIDTGEDTFRIYSLRVSENDISSLTDGEFVNNGDYYFVEQSDGSYKSNNQGISNSTAHSYMMFDLTNASTDQDIYVNATISSEGSCDIGYITVTNDTTAPEYNDSTNKYVYVSGYYTSRYKVPLKAGEINYVHFGYRKDGSVNNGNDAFTIESIIYYADSSPVPIYIGRDDIVEDEEISYVTPILNEEVDKVQVIRNITLTNPIDIVETRDVELDLNGYTITTSRSDYVIKNNGSLKIIDSKYTSDEVEAEEQYNREMQEYNVAKAKYDQDLIEYNEYLASPDNLIENNYVLNYDFTNDVQEFVVPETGVYKLETWGAQGGSSDYKTGGYGGYSVGEITLNKYDKLYIYVGGSGSCAWGSSSEGGYNGGGGSLSRNGSYALCSGGGATHIATEKGLLSTLSDKVNSILMVSGAGGGAGSFATNGNNGASGGGAVGNSIYSGSSSTGGSQLSGGSGRAGNGSFGLGSGSSTSYSCGGGAGFYGGGSDAYEWGAAGGSGYIGNESLINKKMVCLNCSPDSSVNTKTETTSNFSDEAKPEYAKAGNGYARITLIDEDAKARIEAEPRKEYTVTTLPEEPVKPVKQEVTLTGNITSTTSSVILNDYDSYLEIENGIINLDKSGSLDIITNKGTVKLGSDALLNGLQANNRGINNTSSGDILDGSGTISMSSSNNIGILNNSFNDNSIKGYKLSNTSTNSYNIYNNSKNAVTYENITSTGSGIDIYQTSNENLIVKNSSLESTSNESYYSNETTEVSNVEFNNCTIKNRIFNRSKSARTILIKDSDLSGSRGNVYNYGGKITINHSDLENTSYNIQNNTETDVIGESTLVSTDQNNYSISNSEKDYNSPEAILNIIGSTITSSNKGIENNKGTSTITNSTINASNNAVYNGFVLYSNKYSGTVNLNNTTVNKTGDSDINVVYNYYGDININGGSINNESNDSTAIYNENNTDNIITIKGNYSNSNNFNKGIYNTSILTLGDNTDSVSKTYPSINASSSAIYNTNDSTFNYYDGKLVGIIDNTLDGIVSDMPDAHDIYVTKGNSTEDIVLKTKSELDTSEDYVAKIGTSKYTTIQSAFDAVSNNNTETEVELLKNIETASTATIDNNKNIKLKYAGYYIKAYNNEMYFDNNGTFTLVDGNNVVNNKSYSNDFINNNGTVNYNSAISMAIRTNKILNNNINSTFNMTGGEIYSYQTRLLYNDGTINMSGGKLYTTRTDWNYSENHNLIENDTNGQITLDGGDITFIGYGSVINNKNRVIVNNTNVNLLGYTSGNRWGWSFTYFINNVGSSSYAKIAGGTYGQTNREGLLIGNEGTAVIENVTSKLMGSFINSGTLTSTNTNMEELSYHRNSDGASSPSYIGNTGTMTITGGSYKGHVTNGFINNNGTLRINGATLYQDNCSTYGGGLCEMIYAQGASDVDIKNSTIERSNNSDSYNVIYAKSTSTINIENSNLINNKSNNNARGILQEDSSVVTLTNVNISTLLGSAIQRSGSGNLIINGGEIVNQNGSYGLYNSGSGTITIGTLGGVPSKTNPAITGKTYGLYNTSSSSILNFYDGIISGQTAIYGKINNVEPTYDIVLNVDENNIEHKYLDQVDTAKNKRTTEVFHSIQEALNDEHFQNGDTIEILREITTLDNSEAITIPASKEVTIDLKGFKISQNNEHYIVNNGTLTMKSSEDGGQIISNNEEIFDNNGELIIDSGNYTTSTTNPIINNQENAELTINGGEIYSYETCIITNNGTLNITGGKLYATRTAYVNALYDNLIENYETGIMDISGGEFTYIGTGSVINNRNLLTISNAKVDLYGYYNGPWHYIRYTTFIYNSLTTSNAVVTGGTYGETNKYGIFISNNGTARVEGVTSNLNGSFNNTGTLNMINNTFENISGAYDNNDEVIVNSGTLNITGGSYVSSGNIGAALLTSSGTLNITNSNITNSHRNNTLLLNSSGSTTITGSTIVGSDNTSTDTLKVQDSASLTMNNSEITDTNQSNSTSALNISTSGLVSLTDTDISATNVHSIYKTGSGTFTINGGDIISSSKIGLYNTGSGIVNIGTLGGTVSTTKPNIKGSTYGLYNSNNNATINFYDGILTGETAMYGSMTEVEPNYEPINVQNQDSSHSIYLSRVLLLENNRTHEKFYDITEAINSQNTMNGDTFEFLRDYTVLSNYSTVTVGSNKEVTLDLKGYKVSQYNEAFITNNGDLTIKSSVPGGSIETNHKIFVNNGTLNIESGTYYTITTSTIIENSAGAILNISGGEIYSYETNIISNSGTLNISSGKIYTSRTGWGSLTSYDLITNESTGSIYITGGELTFTGNGSVINNKNVVNVSNTTVNLNGGYGNYRYEYSTFINNSLSTSNATITGGTYGNTSKNGILLRNSGTARIEGVTNNLYGSVYNTGTINMINNNMEEITNNSSTNEFITNSGTMTVSGGRYEAVSSKGSLFTNSGSLSLSNVIITNNSANYSILSSNNSTTTLSNSTITDNNSGSINYSGTGTFTLNNTDITSSSGHSINKTSSGDLTISGGTIESTGGCVINNSGSGIITITVGSLKSNTTNAITTSAGTVIIGTSGGVPSTTNPSIYGKTYGLYNSGVQDIIYFYDGVIKGETGSIYGTITDTEGGYKEKRDNVTDPITGITTVDSTLTVVGSEEKVAVVNNINFLSIQSAVNYASNNGIEAITLYKSITLEDNLIKPAGGSNVKIYLNNYTITQGSYTIDSGIDLVAGTPPTGASLSRFLANISGDELNVKNIVLFEMDDGSYLEASKIYKLYRLVDGRQKLVKVKENNIGNYNIGNDSTDIRTIDGKIYINDIGEGEYKLIGSDSKEMTFTVSYEGVSNNIRINNKANTRRVVDAVATLILTLQTGVVRSPYILIIMLLVLGILCFIAYGKYKEQHNKE